MDKENRMDSRKVPSKRTKINIRAVNASSSRMTSTLVNDTRGTSLSQESDTGTDFFVHPFKSKGRGWRSGQDITAGKTMKKDLDGFEKIEDYLLCLSETDEESVQELSGLENTNKKNRNIKEVVMKRNSRKNIKAHKINSSEVVLSALAVPSKGTSRNQSEDNTFVHPFKVSTKGWRSGRNFKANEMIRKVHGFEQIEDYFTESDADSMSVSRLSEEHHNDTTARESLVRNVSTHDSSSKVHTQKLSEGRCTRQKMRHRMSGDICNNVTTENITEANNNTCTLQSQDCHLVTKTSVETNGKMSTNEVPEHTSVSNLVELQTSEDSNSDSDKSGLAESGQTRQPLNSNKTCNKSVSEEGGEISQASDIHVQNNSNRKSREKHSMPVTLETTPDNKSIERSEKSQSKPRNKKNTTRSNSKLQSNMESDSDSPRKANKDQSGCQPIHVDVCDVVNSEELDNTITPAQNVTNVLNSDDEGIQSSQESSQASQEEVSGTVKKQPFRISSGMPVQTSTMDHSTSDGGVSVAMDSHSVSDCHEACDLMELQSTDNVAQTKKPMIFIDSKNLLKSENHEVTLDTATEFTEKTELLAPRVSHLRLSQVSIDAAGTMTGSITKSQIAKTSSEETPLTIARTRKRLSYSVVLGNQHGADSTTRCSSKDVNRVSVRDVSHPVGGNWLSSMLSTHENGDTEKVDIDTEILDEDPEDFVLIDNTQTFTLKEVLPSKQTKSLQKGKLKKSASSESDDLDKKKTQKSCIKTAKTAKIEDHRKIKSPKSEIEEPRKTHRRKKNTCSTQKRREQNKVSSSESENIEQTNLQKLTGNMKRKTKEKNLMSRSESRKKDGQAETPKLAQTSESSSRQEHESDESRGMMTSLMSIDDGIFKSGVSLRTRKRTASLSPIPKSPKDKIFKKWKEKNGKKEKQHVDPKDKQHASPTTSTPLTDSEELPNVNVSGLTPCLSKPGSRKAKKGRRVTINEASAILSISIADHGTNETAEPTPSLSSSPKHFFEVTSSQTPKPFEKPTKCKIIYPKPAPEGLRRSQRTRVVGLEWYKNERIVYDRRRSGIQITGIKPSNEAKYMKMEEERRKRRKTSLKKRKKMSHSQTPRNLSVHAEIEDNIDITCSQEIAVFNPEDREEVLIDCISSRDSQSFTGLSGEEPRASDPYIICRDLCHPSFKCGDIVLRPLKEKPTEYVWDGILIFSVLKGKVAVTIHKTTTILESGDKFFIPSGNTYKILNLRTENAKLSFTIMHLDTETTKTDSMRVEDS